MGEAVLRQWAGETGLVCNPVERDAAGWDFLLEFPLPSPGELPLDKTPRPVQAFVQVKSTDTPGQRFNVKLDNWLRMVRTPMPAFFLILEYDGASYPERAFLQHVGVVRTPRSTSFDPLASQPILNARSLPIKAGPPGIRVIHSSR
jgi:hypothetical protein